MIWDLIEYVFFSIVKEGMIFESSESWTSTDLGGEIS